MHPSLKLLPVLLLAVGACAPGSLSTPPATPVPPATAEATTEGRVGVLVMAHGGSPEWDASVRDAVVPLKGEMPVEVAFGMADPTTLAEGIDRLEEAGVGRVAVVRMFLSGESFWDQTAYLLGMSDTPPERFLIMNHGPGGHHGAHHGGNHAADPEPVAEGMTVVSHSEGMMQSSEAADIIASRAEEQARNPGQESVLILAHGMGDEGENDRVLQAMEEARTRTAARGFSNVQVASLQEDWPEARAVAEQEIRTWVQGETTAGRRVIVVPYRLSGFGPYAQVLEGLEYTPTEGLLPHPRITDWIRRTAAQVICRAGWEGAPIPCGAAVASPEEMR